MYVGHFTIWEFKEIHCDARPTYVHKQVISQSGNSRKFIAMQDRMKFCQIIYQYCYFFLAFIVYGAHVKRDLRIRHKYVCKSLLTQMQRHEMVLGRFGSIQRVWSSDITFLVYGDLICFGLFGFGWHEMALCHLGFFQHSLCMELTSTHPEFHCFSEFLFLEISRNLGPFAFSVFLLCILLGDVILQKKETIPEENRPL